MNQAELIRMKIIKYKGDMKAKIQKVKQEEKMKTMEQCGTNYQRIDERRTGGKSEEMTGRFKNK